MNEIHDTVRIEAGTESDASGVESVFVLDERVTRPVKLPMQRLVHYEPQGEADGAFDNQS